MSNKGKLTWRLRAEWTNSEMQLDDDTLREQLKVCVDTLHSGSPLSWNHALMKICHEIQKSTSATCSKALRFLRPHFGVLKECFSVLYDNDLKKYLADVLSFLAQDEKDSLKYRLWGSKGDIGFWGLDYARSLAGECVVEIEELRMMGYSNARIVEICSKDIVAVLIKHNAVVEAVNLLLLVGGNPDLLIDHCSPSHYKSICLHLTRCARLMDDKETQSNCLEVAMAAYGQHREHINGLRIALFIDNPKLVAQCFESCDDLAKLKQLCFIVARHGIVYHVYDEISTLDESDCLQKILDNSMLSEFYLSAARDIGVSEHISAENNYKAQSSCDGNNLAATFPNAFVSAGFCKDNLMTSSTCGISQKFWSHDRGAEKISAIASLGVVHLWDVHSGYAKIYEYMDSSDIYTKVGALIGIGICSCNIRSDLLLRLAPLERNLDNDDLFIKIGAVIGIGIASAGCRSMEICRRLCHGSQGSSVQLDVLAFTSLSLGLNNVGSCNGDALNFIVKSMSFLPESDWEKPLAQFLPLSIGLIFLGKGYKAEEFGQSLDAAIGKYCFQTLYTCGFAGVPTPGSVRAQIHKWAKNPEKCFPFHGVSVLGIALASMAEESPFGRTLRKLQRCLDSTEKKIYQAVPLALCLLYISNPEDRVMEILTSIVFSTDSVLAMSAVISIGLIGAGTRDTKIDEFLAKVSSFYREGDCLHCVRIAQALVHLGEGMLTLNSYRCERFLISPTALAGILITLYACFNLRDIILGKYPYVLYYLVLAMQPRMLVTVYEKLKPLSVPVRVGQAMDLTPVLLSSRDRAVISSDRYDPVPHFLEGIVVLKENLRKRKRLKRIYPL